MSREERKRQREAALVARQRKAKRIVPLLGIGLVIAVVTMPGTTSKDVASATVVVDDASLGAVDAVPTVVASNPEITLDRIVVADDEAMGWLTMPIASNSIADPSRAVTGGGAETVAVYQSGTRRRVLLSGGSIQSGTIVESSQQQPAPMTAWIGS